MRRGADPSAASARALSPKTVVASKTANAHDHRMSTAMVISRRGRRSICGASWTYITAVPSNIPSATDVLGSRHVQE